MRLTVALITVGALGTTGCELAGPILLGLSTGGGHASGAPTGVSTATLSVQVRSAQGRVGDQTLAPEMLMASGQRSDQILELHLVVKGSSTGARIEISTSQAESSGSDPYGGSGGSGFGDGGFAAFPVPFADAGVPFFGSDGGFADPEGALLSAPSGDVMICDSAGNCRLPQDFDLQLVQAADGKDAIVRATWNTGETVRLTLHYVEHK